MLIFRGVFFPPVFRTKQVLLWSLCGLKALPFIRPFASQKQKNMEGMGVGMRDDSDDFKWKKRQVPQRLMTATYN